MEILFKTTKGNFSGTINPKPLTSKERAHGLRDLDYLSIRLEDNEIIDTDVFNVFADKDKFKGLNSIEGWLAVFCKEVNRLAEFDNINTDFEILNK